MPKHQTTVLLTGATGLLGSYVLASLLRRRIPTAVLARHNSLGSANQRIEAVIGQFESECLLPRPKVIAGSLQEQNCGVAAVDQNWLKRRRLVVIHSAASLKFDFEAESGEPYQTNVEGLKALLALLEPLDLRAFHLISTAYVGDREQQRSFEVPMQTMDAAKNDYERSKIQAERIVLDWATDAERVIHRPSIIVGDSQTGFTSTFHGFYAPLQLGVRIAEIFGFSRAATEAFKQGLGLDDNDTKNLVPVDWVAECITETAISRGFTSDLQGDDWHFEISPSNSVPIFHWTNPQATPVRLMQQALNDVLQERFPPPEQESELSVGFAEAIEGFRNALHVYRSYFDADPEFDRSQADKHLPKLKCPKMGIELLKKLGHYAVEKNFGWPRPRLPDLSGDKIVLEIRGLANLLEERGLRSLPEHLAYRQPFLFELSLLGPDAPSRIQLYFNHAEQEIDDEVMQSWDSELQENAESGNKLFLEMSLNVFRDVMAGNEDIFLTIANGDAILLGGLFEGWEEFVQACMSEFSEPMKS